MASVQTHSLLRDDSCAIYDVALLFVFPPHYFLVAMAASCMVKDDAKFQYGKSVFNPVHNALILLSTFQIMNKQTSI